MENLASMASAVPSKLLLLLVSPSHPSTTTISSAATAEKSFPHVLRGCLALALHGLFFLLRLASLPVSPALSRAFHPKPPATSAATATSLRHYPAGLLPPPASAAEEGSTYVARALSHVLAVVTHIPVCSRKYELARGLADRLLDENLRCGSPALAGVNRAALTSAFSRTLRRLEAAVLRGRGTGGKADGSVERLLGGVRSRLRRWADPAEEGVDTGEWAASGGGAAEKLAAEVMWLAQKMAACGAAGEAVARWGAAAGLARLALAVEPRLQGTLVRISGYSLMANAWSVLFLSESLNYHVKDSSVVPG